MRSSEKKMALYRYLQPLDALPDPNGRLSSSVSPSAIKDANEAVRGATHKRKIYQIRDSKQQLVSMPHCTATIITLAWQFFTNNSSPDILVDMVASHHCLNQQNDTSCEGAWQHASTCVRKENFFKKPVSHLCENLYHQKFPTIRY